VLVEEAGVVKEEVDGLKEEVDGLKEEVDGLKEANQTNSIQAPLIQEQMEAEWVQI
jgi:hypothetical protein